MDVLFRILIRFKSNSRVVVSSVPVSGGRALAGGSAAEAGCCAPSGAAGAAARSPAATRTRCCPRSCEQRYSASPLCVVATGIRPGAHVAKLIILVVRN